MSHVLVLRTSNKDGTAHGGFQWPASGMVECPDWMPVAECGNGLHGILWPEGDWSDIKTYPEELWQVVKVLESDIVRIDGKVKFPRGEVVYSGSFAVAFTMVAKDFTGKIPKSYASAVDADDPLTTDKKNAKIGSSGDSAQIGSSGYYAKIGSSGDYAQIGSSGYYAKIDSTGKDAVIACAGSVSKFRVGPGGCISAPWNDGKRVRFAVGYAGENIKADTWYFVDKGEFKEAA